MRRSSTTFTVHLHGTQNGHIHFRPVDRVKRDRTPPDLHPQIYMAGTPIFFTDFSLKCFQRSWTPKKINISTSQPVASCQTLWQQKMVARWCHRAHITKMTMIIQGKMSKNKNRKSSHLKDAWHNDISDTVNISYIIYHIYLYLFIHIISYYMYVYCK